MGAKASTPANSGHQSPRSRTFSSSSTGAELQNSSVDRQRARSLSSVPDMHGQNSNSSSDHHSQQTQGITTANSNNYASSSTSQQGHNNHMQRHTLGDNLRVSCWSGCLKNIWEYFIQYLFRTFLWPGQALLRV